MSFLFDNLIATMLTGLLILLLATTSLRQSDEAQSISGRGATAGSVASLSLGVRADFSSILSFQAATDSTVTFAISADPISGTQSSVTYHRRARGNVFDLVRIEGSATTPVATGLSSWSVVLRDASGAATTDAASAMSATVRFTSSVAFSEPGSSTRVVWENTFAPPLLSGIQF